MKLTAIKTVSLLSVVTASSMLLTGCFEGRQNTKKVCGDNPELCAELNVGDGQCRFERSDLVFQRLAVKEKPSDLNKFEELKLVKRYQRCMELVASIEPTTLKSKKTLRTEALFHAYEEIDRLNEELRDSYQPAIIYYRWSHGDNAALEQFLKLEGTKYLETPELQLGLATYYVDKDKPKTIIILKHALALFDGKNGDTREKVLPEAIKSLATANHASQNMDAAYMWAMVGKQFNLPITNQTQLDRMYPMSPAKRKLISDVADDIASAIDDGDFQATMVNALTPLKEMP